MMAVAKRGKASESARRTLSTLTFVAVAASAMAGCKAEGETARTHPQPVQVITVVLKPETPAWSYVGTVRPRYESDLAFRLGGKIVSRLVEIGERVEAGQAIASLDPTDLQLAVEAQKAELAAARISRDETSAALMRFQTLYERGHVAKAAVDQRTSAAAEARSRVERAERSVALADNQLAYATLKADQPGVISVLPVEAGQVVTVGQLVARVARLSALEAEVAVPEQKLEAVRLARAEVELWADGGRRIPVTLREVSPEADAASRTYRARFALGATTGGVDLGRTATVYLSGATGTEVASLPLSAVTNDGKGAVAWVVAADGARVVPTPVDVQSVEQDRVVIRHGLKQGDRVVTLGVHMLDANKPIRVIEQRAALR